MGFIRNLLNGFQLSLFDNDAPVVFESSTSTAKKYRIVLCGQVVEYGITRTRRRSIGMVVGADGLSVRASARVTLREIEQALYDKANWIVKHLNKRAQGLSQPEVSFVPDLNLNDGDSLNILGRSTVVRWVNGGALFDAAGFWLNHQLELSLPDVPIEQRVVVLKKALSDVLMVFLLNRVAYYQDQYGLYCRQIILSHARTLWGTCRADGLIRINSRLVFLDADLADYVLAHELAHTVHINHSAQFWSVVQGICPQYKQHSKKLKLYNLRAT